MLIYIYILVFIVIVFISNTILYSEEVYVSIGLLCFLLYLLIKIESNILIFWLNEISIENQQVKKSLYEYEYFKLKIQLAFINKIRYLLNDVLYYFFTKVLYLLKLYNEETFLKLTDKSGMVIIKIELLIYLILKKYYINYVLYNYNYLYKMYEQKELMNVKNSFILNFVKFNSTTFEFLTSNWFDNVYTVNIELNYETIEKTNYELLSFEDELITNLRIKLFTIADDLDDNEALKRKNIIVQNLSQNDMIEKNQLELMLTDISLSLKISESDFINNLYNVTCLFKEKSLLETYLITLYKERYSIRDNLNEVKIKNMFLFFYFNLDVEFEFEDLDLFNMIEIRTLNMISEDFEFMFYNLKTYDLINQITLTDEFKILVSELLIIESNYQRAEEMIDIETEDDYYIKDEIVLLNEDFLDDFYVEFN